MIRSDSKNYIRYKTSYTGPPTKNGWMKTPFLDIIEDPQGAPKKPGGSFCLRPTILSYGNGKKKLCAYIDIYTCDSRQPNKKATSETLFAILTHEYGHFISWKNKMRPNDYEEGRAIFSLGKKFWHRLTDREKKLIIEEEQRAWNEGMKFVKSKGFKLSSDFYARKRKALATYYRALK